MIPVDVRWGADVNRLKIYCSDCGHTFWIRLDRWSFRCTYCGNLGYTETARNKFVKREYAGSKDLCK